MTDPELPKPTVNDTPPAAAKALSMLKDMDTYIQQLRDPHAEDSSRAARSNTTDQDPTSPPPAATQAQAAKAQAWIEEHAAALEHRRQQLDEQAASQEILQSQLQDMRLRLVREGKKLKQEWAALAQEKKTLAKKRASWEERLQAMPAQTVTDDQRGQDGSGATAEHDRLSIQTQRRQVERAWALVKKEKAALVRQRRRLKLEAQSLGQQSEAHRTGPQVTQERLDHYRQQLQDQFKQLRAGEAVVDLARQQYGELLDQRQVLSEVKRYLGSCETEMIRRWSTHRGVGLVGAAVSCFLLLLLLSFGIGHRIVKPVWRARTVVGITATVFDESRYGSAWVTKKHQMLVGDALLGEAIRLGAQRGVRIFDHVGGMREALSQGLSVHLQSPGQISLEFRHTDKQLVIDVLKSLGRAFVNHHTVQDRVSGRANSMRIFEAAARDPKPIKDGRTIASLATLLVLSLFVAGLALMLRWWMMRSVSVFEQQVIPELEQLEDPELWPTDLAHETRFNAVDRNGSDRGEARGRNDSADPEASDDDCDQDPDAV